MPQCEMCGAEQASLTTTKVEGAELELCSSCTDFGTEVREEPSSSAGSKYSTSSSSGTPSSSSSSSGSGGSSGGSQRPRDMFDDMEEIATDYDDRIRKARESKGLSQEELADDLNEKASLIRKLERGDTLPTDEIQRKLERALDVSLVEGEEVDADWESNDAGTMTLGDVVKRKD
ncbi:MULTISPECIES: multiprotein bridging factor aMBF1 [Haloferacaceae]|uniref:Multiprotein bridging factor aMBF1 n=1 Tax=Halorubrum glutamatedens TaxID=2707018 RepID=A0ABD5QSV4_9EURY|nr:multiprotein bridging factor aMBF1 [Halobellus captivus]